MVNEPAAPFGPLPIERLRRRCDPAALSFATTSDITPVTGLIGQRRAAEALAFGLAVPDRGYNVFVSGPGGTGKTTAVKEFLADAAHRPAPDDWCYVHNFADPTRPQAMRLPPGAARRLFDGLRHLVEAARRDIPRAFESEEYIAQREAILGDLNRAREQGMTQIGARAQAGGFALQPTPVGLAIIPVMNNQPLTDDAIAQLRPEMREAITRGHAQLEEDIRAFLKQMRQVERETRTRLEAQDRDVALHAVGGVVDDLADQFTDQPAVTAWIATVREGILADLPLFRGHPLPADGGQTASQAPDGAEHALHEREFRKYSINVLVDSASATGAPVELELNPTYPNLIGRIEREALFGALVTDFSLISAGALHRANGGYLVLRVEDLLRAPMSWEALKRALRTSTITIEDVSEALGLASTRGLRPDPIPLDLKVFLVGDLATYHLLYSLDSDFKELFKVRADFETDMERSPENEAAYAAYLAGCTRGDGLPLDRTAVARLIEEASRLVEDQRKLSARFGQIGDLARESAYYARVEQATVVSAAHVQRAIAQRQSRAALIPEREREMIARGVLLIRPTGQAIGQIHGLAVITLGDTMFGRVSRITASAGVGSQGLVDIERQVALGGPIHSKGVLILGGYLTDRYASDKPLALSARLVFEQSYEGIEGDSASLAELLVLLSRLAEAPVRQGIAVTGSINQRGEVQAVGGVNAKIEGFFEACTAAGLTGDQGVILPVANVEHLMLRDDVLESVAAGKFHVYGVANVDEALFIMTGIAAGERDAGGTYPIDSIHGRVDQRLRRLAIALREFAGSTGDMPGMKANGAHALTVPARQIEMR